MTDEMIGTFGGDMFERMSKAVPGDKQWDIVETSFLAPNGMTVFNTSFTSPSFDLMTGEAHFTFNPLFHVPFPKGNYAIIDNKFRILEGNGTEDISLAETYNHHWLIGTKTSIDPLEYCEGSTFWGAGAEMRGMKYKVPEGYGIVRFNASGTCGANLHFIRTEDLAVSWDGFNDPKGNHGAAVKNCIECGYAPGRSIECLKILDGDFACCFSGSRCPVNNPDDRSTKSYRLQYNISWTREVTSVKPLQGVVLDVSGGAIEWNVAPNLNNKDINQTCTDKVCTITKDWTVGHQKGFGTGICAGRMLWSYTHQHTGAINATFFVNGSPKCTSKPIVGTDPTNKPGNEKGYVIKFTSCIDRDELKNDFVLHKGDQVSVQVLYDVDVNSTRNLPFPGGKHGGVMGLFFAMMDCDAGTFGERYTCYDHKCFPIIEGGGEFATKADCTASCK
eukprot:CAMPEP_0175141964 /NCGR_PEP_ID=MMETSP0087-20121206/12454_1 /TAXON_ID=136419 /ORGANISM="Unknown Unknown, Strain D1" /LENGTH=445 /DNA_ID=CAMNT_0016425551 /DNA_START=110 /DNA_END=1447 /DNA_ORIENTATION=-